MEQTDKIVVQKLKKIAIISLIFMTIEIFGGALAHSIAIMADAFHLLSDVIAYVISLYAVLLSKRLAPKYLPFGYEKAQPLGALINVAIIWMVTVELFIQATHRIIEREVVQQPLYMLLTSIFGLCCNLYIMRTLHSQQGGHCGHSHGHSHDHGHSHSDSHDKCNHNHLHEEKTQQRESQQIEAVCSCNSPDEINRLTKETFESSRNMKDFQQQELGSPLPNRLSEGLVQKKKGYCAIHTSQKGQKKSNHGHDHHGHDQHGHDHHEHDHNSHGHDHNDHGDHHHGKFFQNINIQAAYIHIISDIILSIGVIISASIIYFFGDTTTWTGWQLADPFCTYLFSIVALFSTWSIIKESMLILMDGCENEKLLNECEGFVKRLENTYKWVQIEDMKVWSSNRGKYYCAMRIARRKNSILSSQNVQKTTQKEREQQETIYNSIVKFCKQKSIKSYIEMSVK